MQKLITTFQKLKTKRYFHFFVVSSLLVILLAVFYPTRYVAVDEHDYLFNAKNIITNELRMDCDANDVSQFKVDDYCIYKYNIGTSLILLPAVLFSDNAAFVATMLCFILAIYTFSKLLDKFKLAQKYIYLFALFLPFVYYSRTLYSEIFSMTFFLSGIYFLVDQKSLRYFALAGLLLGMSVLIRYTNIFPITIFTAFLVIKGSYKTIAKQLLSIALGALPTIVVFLYINNYLYGSFLRSGYYFSGEESLHEWSAIITYAPIYLLLLLLMYPGMILSIKWIAHKWLKLATIISTLLLLLFYSSFPGGNTVIEYRLLDLIFALRYFIPIIPFMLLGYASVWKSLEGKNKVFEKLYVVFIIILVLLVTALNYVHQIFLVSGEVLI